ncbi:MAG: YybS family protein [Bacillota bacterium]
MNTQKDTRAMVEAALMVAITSLFAIASRYIPFLTFVTALIPTPFILLGKRHGLRYEILSILAAAFVIGGLTSPIYSLFVVALPGITAIVMGYMMNKGYTAQKVWMAGTAAALVATLLSINLVSFIMGIDYFQDMFDAMRQGMDINISLYEKMGVEGKKIEEVKASIEYMIQFMSMAIPSVIILSSILAAYINLVLSTYVLNRIGYAVEKLPSLKHFRLPKSIIMGTFIIILLTIATSYLKIVHSETLVVNVVLLLQMIYFFQGIAVVHYFMTAYNLRKFVRILIWILIFTTPNFAFIVTMLGFVDAVIDLRRLK